MPAADSRFLAACRGRPVDRLPIWMMRQAGRYLPEYRALRAQADFLTMCRTPELAAEATLQPIRRFGFDAAILFSDIMIPAAAMGVEVRFAPGPVLPEPVRDEAAIARLSVPDPEEALPFVGAAVRRIVRELPAGVPLIGFAGAPFTLGAYLVEGRGSRDFAAYKRFLWRQPAAGRRLLALLAETAAVCLEAQVAAGARAVQLFDTWAGLLGPEDFRAWIAPVTRDLIARLRDTTGVPVIYFAKGAGPYLEEVAALGADVLGLDWTVDAATVRARLAGVQGQGEASGFGLRASGYRPSSCIPDPEAWSLKPEGAPRSAIPHPLPALQGNLDPLLLQADPATIEARTRAMCAALGRAPGYIANCGHGLPPETPIESVQLVVDTVHSFPVTGASGPPLAP